ncbi:MAG: hypothetical protein QM758_15800 [Armatimonas sp.]
MNIRTRLTLWNVGILALLLLGMGCVLHARVQGQWVGALDAELLRRAHFFDGKKPPLAADFPKGKPLPKFPLFDSKGQPVLGKVEPTDPEAIQRSLQTRHDVFSDRGAQRVLTHHYTFTDGTRYVFQTSESRAPTLKELAALTRELFLLLPVGLPGCLRLVDCF